MYHNTRTRRIMALHNFLYSFTLHHLSLSSLCVHSQGRLLAVSLYFTFFSMSCEYSIFQALFPHNVSQKFDLFISLKLPCCSHVQSIMFLVSFCETPFLLPQVSSSSIYISPYIDSISEHDAKSVFLAPRSYLKNFQLLTIRGILLLHSVNYKYLNIPKFHFNKKISNLSFVLNISQLSAMMYVLQQIGPQSHPSRCCCCEFFNHQVFRWWSCHPHTQ